jgi:hypothetical protein
MRSNNQVTEQTEAKKTSFINQMLKVIYAPHKVFKEIKEKPKMIGPILILILFIAANVGFAYAVLSKTYIEQTFPTAEKLDEWTEKATMWTQISQVTISENFGDFINGSYYGNRSIEFSAVDSTQVSTQLGSIGPVNCSGPDGYKNLSIRVKLVSPTATPANVSIYLYSSTPADYFLYNLTEAFASSTANVWNNLTIPLGNENWTSSSTDANWGKITGMRADLMWPEESNITILIDGMFFRGVFKTPLDTTATAYLFNYASSSSLQFVVQWVILSGLIYIMIRGFGTKTSLRLVLVLIGFALMALLIQAVINAAIFSALPRLNYSLELIGGVRGESDIAYNSIWEGVAIFSNISNYLRIVIYVWIVGLCAFATRSMSEYSWPKTLLIAGVAFLGSITFMSLLLGI